MVNVELRAPGAVGVVAAGMICPVLFEGKYCGPVIEPVGPMIWSTWLEVKLLVSMGRSNVTFIELVVPPVIRLPSARSPFCTVVDTTCGPGTMIGRVF